MDQPLKSVTHSQCDARPTITFPATGNDCPVTSTKLYWLVIEAHVCEQLAQGCYIAVERPGIKLSIRKPMPSPLNHISHAVKLHGVIM